MYTSTILLSLTGAALATTSPSFTLRATPVGESCLDVDLTNYVVSSAHFGAGQDRATLSSNATLARQLVLNGTAEERASGQTSVFTSGGSPSYPYGFDLVLFNPDEAGNYTAQIDVGYGTKGVGIDSDGDSAETFVFRAPEGAGKWSVCNSTIYGSIPILALGWSTEVLEQCQEITLTPVCDGPVDLGTYGAYAYDAPCVSP